MFRIGVKEEAQADAAKAAIAAVAEELGLSEVERRSYLELVNANRQ